MYNKLFENMDSTEQKAVKFAFELVGKNDLRGCKLVRLVSNGTTGYPVYYLYMVFNGQSYVLRIIKQGRKCKLMSFGNPKLIWAFVHETKAKMPTRKQATLESIVEVFKQQPQNVTNIINWINRTIMTSIKASDFGYTKEPVSKFDVINKPVRKTTSTTKTPTTHTSETKKQAVFAKLVKAIVDEHKKSTKPMYKNYIRIDLDDLYYNNRKTMEKYWESSDDFLVDVYKNDWYKIHFPKYNTQWEIHKAGYWSSWDTKSYCERIEFYGQPAKEFDSLNKYITGVLKCKELKWDDVKSEYVVGKRSDIFSRTLHACLAFNGPLCLKYKKILQNAKKSNWKAKMTIDSQLEDDGSRYDYRTGEDRECEWEGQEYTYANIKFTTPSGKQMSEIHLTPF